MINEYIIVYKYAQHHSNALKYCFCLFKCFIPNQQPVDLGGGF